MNLRPTNKQFKVNGMTVFSFRDAKVIERWNLVNIMSLMEQLRIYSEIVDAPISTSGEDVYVTWATNKSGWSK